MGSKQISIDVTNLTPAERKKIYKNHFCQNGFASFNKSTNSHKTTYTFTYNHTISGLEQDIFV